MNKFIGILLLLFIYSQSAICADSSSSAIIYSLKRQVSSNTQEKKLLPVDFYKNNNLYSPTSELIELNKKELNYNLFPSETKSFVPPESIIYQEAQRKYNSIDPRKAGSSNSYYPGLRGPNQLIIYTPAYGLRTGTNEFGTEAVVRDNMVVSLNGADSIIPKNGFVISGHGTAKTWILKNIQIGSKVYIDYSNQSLRVFLTPDSLLFAAKEKIKEVSNLVDYYRQIDILYNDKKANAYLENSKNSLRNAEKKPEKTQMYITDAMTSLDSAIKNAIPYYKNELKGVWIRPVENSPEKIRKTVERISSVGITDIFLETYYHGKTLYPSKYLSDYGVISQREEFKGFDPLSVWIEEAHKRNMKVHIWFESFYVGNENPKTTPNHVLSVYPAWANKKFSDYESIDPVPSLSEHNGYFLDPANSQVQSYLIGLIKEIISNYEVDGINLDYVRYPQTIDPVYSNYVMTNWGYTKIARDNFKDMYGVDPVEIHYASTEWELWNLYRQNKVSEFIKKVRELTANSNILLTAVIFPDLNKCKSTKMQNWKSWSINNYVDGFTPLLLTGDKNTAVSLLKDIIKNTNSSTKIYPGLFVTFMGGPYEDLLVQIHKSRELKTKGAVIFDYAHLDDKYADALKTRVYNSNYEKIKTQEVQYSEVNTKQTKKKKKKIRRRKHAEN